MFEIFGTRRSPALRSLRASELDALAPLLALARSKDENERRLWLDDLRQDAPTVAMTLERLLADSAPESGSRSHERPLTAPPTEHPTVIPAPGAVSGRSRDDDSLGDLRPAYRPPALSPGLAR